jgi:hypothetical protein
MKPAIHFCITLTIGILLVALLSGAFDRAIMQQIEQTEMQAAETLQSVR